MFYSSRMTSKALYSAHYHRQYCTLQAFEQFGALYLQNLDDKHSIPAGIRTQYLWAPSHKWTEWAVGEGEPGLNLGRRDDWCDSQTLYQCATPTPPPPLGWPSTYTPLLSIILDRDREPGSGQVAQFAALICGACPHGGTSAVLSN